MPAPRLFLTAVGGVIGATLRWAALHGARLQGVDPASFEAHLVLLAVNVVGCLAIGALWAFTAHDDRSVQLRAVVGVGVCGGLTSFSTFTRQIAESLDDGLLVEATATTALTMVGAIAAVFAGHHIGQMWHPPSAVDEPSVAP